MKYKKSADQPNFSASVYINTECVGVYPALNCPNGSL